MLRLTGAARDVLQCSQTLRVNHLGYVWFQYIRYLYASGNYSLQTGSQSSSANKKRSEAICENWEKYHQPNPKWSEPQMEKKKKKNLSINIYMPVNHDRDASWDSPVFPRVFRIVSLRSPQRQGETGRKQEMRQESMEQRHAELSLLTSRCKVQLSSLGSEHPTLWKVYLTRLEESMFIACQFGADT